MATALTVFKVLTIVSSVIMRVSPFPDFYWIHKHNTTGEVQLLPVITLFVNSGAVVMYACIIENYVPLFITNLFGVCTAIGFIAIFHAYTVDRKYVYTMCAYGAAVTAAILVYTILAAEGVTHESRGEEGTVLGWVTMFTTVVQFGSPLATMKRVIVTKSSASLPFMMCLMNIVNGALWVTYSILKWNAFILAPSVAGVALGVTQVTLWVIYRPREGDKTKTTSNASSDGTHQEDSVAIEVIPPHHNALEHIPSFVANSSGAFAALTSPVLSDP